jgi:hypothetical protein
MSFETFPSSQKGNVSTEKTPDFLKIKERIFHDIIANRMVDTYEQEMESTGYTSEEISTFREKLISLSLEDSEAVYAFPWELKQRALPAFLKKIREGKETIESMTEKIISASHAKHRKIAFHASNENIQPREETVNGKISESWVIYGKENDHRDNDLPMAYYSFDYTNLYRSKNPKYIYAVSIQEDPSAGHRKDGNNEWGRAPSLSVIDKLDLAQIELDVTERAMQEVKEKTTAN